MSRKAGRSGEVRSPPEAVVQFGAAEGAVGVAEVDFFDDFAADGIAEAEAEGDAVLQFVIAADVPESGERTGAVRGFSVEAEGLRLERAVGVVAGIAIAAQVVVAGVQPGMDRA